MAAPPVEVIYPPVFAEEIVIEEIEVVDNVGIVVVVRLTCSPYPVPSLFVA